MKKAFFPLLLCGIAFISFTAHAEAPPALKNVQQGIDAVKTFDTFQDLFTVPALNVNLGGTSTPAIWNGLKKEISWEKSIFSFLKIDAGLESLNREIKETLGIDVLIFLRALVRGVALFFQWVLSLVGQVLPA